ncbi:31214_t:CDS:2, partial [Racocetra persica]
KEAEQATTFSEAKLTTRDELALDSSSFKDNNKENNFPQENILSAILIEEDYTTASSIQERTNKKEFFKSSIRAYLFL